MENGLIVGLFYDRLFVHLVKCLVGFKTCWSVFEWLVGWLVDITVVGWLVL